MGFANAHVLPMEMSSERGAVQQCRHIFGLRLWNASLIFDGEGRMAEVRAVVITKTGNSYIAGICPLWKL